MTVVGRKQAKLAKIFRRKAPEIPDDCKELDEEIKQLEQTLKDKQNELFQIQRCSIKQKLPLHSESDKTVRRSKKVVLENEISNLERTMEVLATLTGMEVKSYVADNHCVIVYHMQHQSQYALQHGLKIDMESGMNIVSKLSLPVDFNFNGVVEEFDNIMNPDCLRAIRRALVAYYERQEQFLALRKLLSIEADLFKVVDGSYMEVAFKAQKDLEDAVDLVLTLEYRLYDIRPKQYTFKGYDVPDEVLEALKNECTAFKEKPLARAFRDCFMKGKGTYNFFRQLEAIEPSPKRHRPHRTPRHQHNADDTYRPDDEESSEEDDEREMRDIYGKR